MSKYVINFFQKFTSPSFFSDHPFLKEVGKCKCVLIEGLVCWIYAERILSTS